MGGPGFGKEDRNSFWPYLRCLSYIQLERWMSMKVKGEVRTRNTNLEDVSVNMVFGLP